MISLYHAGMSSCAQKVRFVLEEKGLEWESILVDLHGGENLTPDFIRMSPKGVVPVLKDDGDLYLESNNICIYLDEKYPDTQLMPGTPKGNSDVRTLAQLVDEHVHQDVSACTYTLAFGPRLRATYDTPEKLRDYLDSIPDAGKRQFRGSVIKLGVDCPEFAIALSRLSAVFERLEGLLQDSEFLVGDQLSIADIIYSPYITRLDHLQMSFIWEDKPGVTAWYERIKETIGYKNGLVAFFNPQVMQGMAASGTAQADKIAALIG